LGLPSTPLKETERRADRWREAFGVEQTEIDALATLRPKDLEEIVTKAIEPFYDASLAARVAAAESEWEEAAQSVLDDQVDGDALAAIKERAAERLAELEAEIERINDQLRMATDGIFDLPPVLVPEPEVDEKRSRQALLISSDWDWAEVTRALMLRKAYGGGE
jgi:hypothetical protein